MYNELNIITVIKIRNETLLQILGKTKEFMHEEI